MSHPMLGTRDVAEKQAEALPSRAVYPDTSLTDPLSTTGVQILNKEESGVTKPPPTLPGSGPARNQEGVNDSSW